MENLKIRKGFANEEKGMVGAMRENFEKQVEELLKQLTLDEKIGMIHGNGLFRTEGVARLGIPPLKSSDGPMGVRNEFENARWVAAGTTDDFVSYLPSNSAIASTWNTELAKKSGRVLGEEARGRGKDVILAPGINIKRSPLCGRNFEYMSEDPKVVEEMTVPLIEGIQENDVAACVKHFAANSQETDRLWVDTIVDERTLREIYLPGFEAAVKRADTYSLMGAYNLLNGAHCCENKELLDRILRDDWGYDGTVISDWGGVHKTKEAAECSLDVEMSVTDNFDNYVLASPLKEAVKKGEIEESHIDAKVRNILRMMFRLKMIGEKAGERKPGTYNTPEHREAVLETARESVVLLKNEDNRLPIKTKGLKKIAVIGRNAECIHSGGGGSAEIKALYEISPLMGLKTKLGGNTEVVYAKGYYIPEKQNTKVENWQATSLEKQNAEELKAAMKEKEEKEKKLAEEIRAKEKEFLEEAVKLAASCEEVIFVGGLNHDWDVEGSDKPDMKLPYGQEELILALLEANPNTVITFVAGTPVEMNRFSKKAKAIVWSYYAGMESGNALAEVLLGKVNPSGKLAETFPKCYGDCVTAKNGEFAKEGRVEYKEGIYIGYRYFEKENIEPEFCFGHGLSYTAFDYEDMSVEVNGKTAKAEVTVKNTGSVAGAETVQIYVTDKAAATDRPEKELKGFAKVYLQPGESKQVTVLLSERDFSFYDIEKKMFVAASGEFEILAGASSKDIRLQRTIQLA